MSSLFTEHDSTRKIHFTIWQATILIGLHQKLRLGSEMTVLSHFPYATPHHSPKKYFTPNITDQWFMSLIVVKLVRLATGWKS